MSEFHDRLVLFVNEKFEGNLTSFAKEVGISPAQINNYRNNGKILPHKYRDSFEKAGISWKWYETGEGAMFSEAESRKGDNWTVHEAYEMVIRDLNDLTIKEVKELQKRINETFETV